MELKEIILPVILTILTGVIGYLMGIFNKQKDRDFELAKIKASIYNDLFEVLRPALFSDYLEDKSKEENTERFRLWQIALKRSDKLWLYADEKVLREFKELFDAYRKNENDKYNSKLESFVRECRLDVLKSLGKRSGEERYRFITYNLPKEILENELNRLK